MARTLLALLAGLVVMVLTVFLVESAGHLMYPPPPGVDVTNPEALKTLIQSLPVAALAFVVVAWALGAFAGAFVACRIARQHRTALAVAIGAVMIALSAATMVMIPHPVWMIVLGVALPLPMAWLAMQLAGPAPAA